MKGRRLQNVCHSNKTPMDFEEKKVHPSNLKTFLDLVIESLKKGYKTTKVRNNVITLKSWTFWVKN